MADGPQLDNQLTPPFTIEAQITQGETRISHATLVARWRI